MTSASETASSIAPSQRSRKSRFSSPFGSLFSTKSNHINDYSIELDEPLRQYGPGDTIKGTIVLDVARPLGITHIVVALFGYLEVFKNHSRNKTGVRDSAARVASGKGKRWVSEYYGDGFASLFEDEVVLCGEGRLDPKSYHFRFELDFPTNLKLPSSIDFERGTVTYAISATVTRPTTINPATTCNRKVFYKEMIDVALLPQPKPRIVTVEPVSSGSRTKVVRRFTSQSTRDERGSLSQASARSKAGRTSRQVVDSGISYDGSRASSPAQASAVSSASAPSSAARESAIPSEPRSSQTSPSPKTAHGVDTPNQTIMASVQLSRAGCLPGDTVPVTVTVNHTKAVKSIKGVIATLFRQARVDMHPNLPLAPTMDGKKTPKYEDYYPRSKTGLGGLSLSAAGSSQVWRKDLSQTTAPLYIDPRTMSTVVRLNVKAPDDVFPTMRSAPGDMITFRYYIEVIIDINGKLSNQGGISNVDVSSPQPHVNSFEQALALDDQQEQSSPSWGQGCVDTAPIRRAKSTITCNCELVVGSRYSVVSKGKQRQDQSPVEDGTEAQPTARPSTTDWRQNGVNHDMRPHGRAGEHYDHHQQAHYNGQDGYGYDEYGYEQYDPQTEAGWDAHYRYHYQPTYAYQDYNSGQPLHYDHYHHIRPPPLEDESALPEKERLRRAEARLLPSSPPVANGASVYQPEPSAPYIPDENDFESAEAFRNAVANPSAHAQCVVTSAIPTERRPDQATITRDDIDGATVPPQPVPRYEPDEDKNELEHRRLQGLASAPPAHLDLAPGPSAPPAAIFDGDDDDDEPGSLQRIGTDATVQPLETREPMVQGEQETAAADAEHFHEKG